MRGGTGPPAESGHDAGTSLPGPAAAQALVAQWIEQPRLRGRSEARVLAGARPPAGGQEAAVNIWGWLALPLAGFITGVAVASVAVWLLRDRIRAWRSRRRGP